jgi:hypothetical protein
VKAAVGELKTVEVKAFVPSEDFAPLLVEDVEAWWRDVQAQGMFRPKDWFLV